MVPDFNGARILVMETKKGSLLAVLAHPDDETFGIGGTLALYARQGVQVHLICATRGEAGTIDPEYLEGFATIGERRSYELECAAGYLGLASVNYLGYRDSGMQGSPDNQHPDALAAAPIEEVTRKVATEMRRLRPQVVITFDPVGGYKHPDHISIQRATVKAFDLCIDPGYQDGLAPFQPQKLYFNTFPRGFLKLAVRLLRLTGRDPRRFGRNKDIDLLALVGDDFPTHARINYKPVSAARSQATACHASQGGRQMQRGPIAWLMRLAGSHETFMRAYPPAEPGLKEKDLFAGVHPETPDPLPGIPARQTN
jgi:LmbE family N-acetylglucosaminyl deacetylase